MPRQLDPTIRRVLARGVVIPAHPLALTADRQLDERRQRALTRYYVAAGTGGLAVGVHTTQFAIRDSRIGLFAPVLKLAAEVIPLIGFYLQQAVGGRVLSYKFWRAFAEIENVVAIKIAPFNRYQTLDVVRAVAESGRDIALYTGNDDNMAMDLLTPYFFQVDGRAREYRIVGGLLGHWAVWTRRAVDLLQECHAVAHEAGGVSKDLLRRSAEITDTNAAFFDVPNNFAGCIAGLHEVLRRQGLLEGIWCLDPHETLSPGQREEIDRVYAAYPHLNDDSFVLERRDQWLKP